MTVVTPRFSISLTIIIVFCLSACDSGSSESPAANASSQVTFEAPPSTQIMEPPEATMTTMVDPSKTPTNEPTLAPTETPVPPMPTATPTPLPIGLTSSAFESGGFIPVRHARNGDNLSPPLTWSDPPDGTESYAILFVSDPVADGGGTWVLWALYNIPADIRGLSEGLVPDGEGVLEIGGQHLANSYMELTYSGPSPHPIETRRFYMRIYALDTILDTADIEKAAASVDTWIGGTEQTLLKAMEGHVLGQGQISGKYKGESPVG